MAKAKTKAKLEGRKVLVKALKLIAGPNRVVHIGETFVVDEYDDEAQELFDDGAIAIVKEIPEEEPAVEDEEPVKEPVVVVEPETKEESKE